MTFGVALVGVGKIARDQHIPAIAGEPAFELAATASRNATVDGIDSFPDLAALLSARADIPCVSLCTPPQVRYGDARRAIEAGRHVMLEKPPGATLSEVEDLIARARRRGVALFATWHSRHAAAVPTARHWLASRRLESLRIVWKEDVRRWHPGQDWIWQAGGLGVFDPGINALSVMTAILPEPVHLTAAELGFPANRDTPIAASLTFAHPAGASVSAAFDWRQEGPQSWDMHIAASGQEALLRDGGARFVVAGEERAGGPDREYPALYARFAELVAGRIIEADLAPMRHVADAFTLGRRVRLDPFEW